MIRARALERIHAKPEVLDRDMKPADIADTLKRRASPAAR
jgi:hypothetical protein